MTIDEIDFCKLRKDLIDYFGTAIIDASQLALADLSRVESASDEELIDIAINMGINLSNYQIAYNHKL